MKGNVFFSIFVGVIFCSVMSLTTTLSFADEKKTAAETKPGGPIAQRIIKLDFNEPMQWAAQSASSQCAAKSAVVESVIVKTAHLSITEVLMGRNVASIFIGFPADSISIQYSQKALFIQPLITGLSGDIYAMMTDGSTVVLSLVSTSPETRDKFIHIPSHNSFLSNGSMEMLPPSEKCFGLGENNG